MRTIGRLSVLMALFAAMHAQGQTTSPAPAAKAANEAKEPALAEVDTRPAMVAAEAWLSLVDAGSNARSWDTASVLFRQAVTPEKWNEAVQAARGPLGTLENRKLMSATYTRSLPGAPEGEYVVIQFQSRFANRPLATETVVPMRDADGAWRVSGYFVR